MKLGKGVPFIMVRNLRNLYPIAHINTTAQIVSHQFGKLKNVENILAVG